MDHSGVIIRTIGGKQEALPALQFRPSSCREIEQFRDAARLLAEFLARHSLDNSLREDEIRAVFGALQNVERQAWRAFVPLFYTSGGPT